MSDDVKRALIFDVTPVTEQSLRQETERRGLGMEDLVAKTIVEYLLTTEADQTQ
jgi:hypothetical protein